MEILNLLEFLNKTKNIYTLDYASCDTKCVNILDLILADEQFTQKIDLGIVYISQKTLDQVTIIDGLNRILSLSLLLHAICECYKKTSQKNDEAIVAIRNRYLLDGNRTKLRLPSKYQIIYDKIVFGEKLSGREKDSQMFIRLHKFWSQIKEYELQATSLMKMIQKISVIIVESGDIPQRDLYYNLNKDKRNINQLSLIENYLKNIGLKKEWDDIKHLYENNQDDITIFFKDFFTTKLNSKFDKNCLYSYFINYFETMLQYMPEDSVMGTIKRSAGFYNDILNVNFPNETLKRALIQIKMHGGEDTFAYLLSIYEDFKDQNITEATFLEILSTIDEYLKDRSKTPNNVEFNDLISYLNAFITCK